MKEALQAIVDNAEIGDQNPKIWPDIVRPALADRKGWCLFIGTPKGHNHFKELRDRAEKEEGWGLLEFKASETGVVDEVELKAAKAMAEAQKAGAQAQAIPVETQIKAVEAANKPPKKKEDNMQSTYDFTGSSNTSLGSLSMMAAAGGSNTGVGVAALRDNTGSSNTAVGNYSMRCNSSGNNNASLGNSAMRANTTGGCNTAVGDIALEFNTTGTRNTALGRYALGKSTTGSCNIAVGWYAQCSICAGINNTIVIGASAQTSSTTGHTVWGNTLNNVCNCIYTAWSTVSDCRDKTNVKSLGSKYGLALIKKLRPVAFNWDHRDTYVRQCKYEYGQKDGNLASVKEHYGLIAQELKSAIDELDVRFDGLGHDDEKDAYRLTYEELIAPIIKAIQELVAENEEIKGRLEILENKQ